jgi:rhamnosyltransferase
MKQKVEVCAVITTFEADLVFNTRVSRVSEQVSQIVVVNDNPRIKITDFEKFENIKVINNCDNYGIGYSLNTGIRIGESLGYKTFLTLDDDTLICKDYVKQVLNFIDESDRDIGITSLSRENSTNNEKFVVKRSLITSGAIFHIDTFNAVGGFDEGYFIDIVDHKFARQIALLGKECILVNRKGMDHSVGNISKIDLKLISIHVYNHSPFRLYYQVRNSIAYFRQFVFKDHAYAVATILNVPKIIFKALLFEEQKLSRVKNILNGVWDGLTNKQGRVT